MDHAVLGPYGSTLGENFITDIPSVVRLSDIWPLHNHGREVLSNSRIK